ncbi:MAG: aminotransferase class V-fold PLP-dependent enzyme [Rubricoccaceae bacterium]
MLPSQRHLVSLPDDLHFLNGAYMSPLLKSVEAAGLAGLQMKRVPTDITPAHFFDDADRIRRLFAKLVQASDVDATAQKVALIPAVSYGMATLAQNVAMEAGQSIVVLADQFPSHVYPWRRLTGDSGGRIHTVEAPAPLGSPARGADWNAQLLESITSSTALVAVPNVHWADGTVFDLEAVGERCREVGAALVVDGTQSVGAMPFDLEAVRPDALVCAGYKWLLGGYGMGVMVLGERFADGQPLEENWIGRAGSDQFAGLTSYQDAYAPGAVRFDVGERSNPILLPMLAAGIEQILDWTVPAIQERCAMLADRIVAGSRQLGYGAEDTPARSSHLFGLAPPSGVLLDPIRSTLAARNVSVSFRGTAIRVSPHVYNDEADADALVDALAAVA